jgi:chaperonin cofactor prefoldin
MKKYLYGAAVQGIQNFIFETNKLKEIAGASQLIDNISSIDWENEKELSEFEGYCKPFHTVDRDKIIMSAAGNIKYKVNDEEVLRKIVKGFPKHIANYAPGVSISQAVVEIDDEIDVQKAINDLEDKLKVQRNIAPMPVDTGFMGLERARRTGGVAYDKDNEEKEIDRGTSVKIKFREEDTLKLFRKFTNTDVDKSVVPFDLKEITKQTENNSWIAIIHADGNGLGKVLTNMSKIVKEDKREIAFKEFSKRLDIATEKAAKKAFSDKIIPVMKNGGKYPIRPVVLGGDDLTVIIRADLAFDFTKAYLRAFEEETINEFAVLKKYFIDGQSIKGLTACAGIAYIKDSYPFHYGVSLAEELTGEAKKLSKSEIIQSKVGKNVIPSSLSFYKVQSSFTDDLKKMKKRTHFAEESNISFDYGPYFIDNIEGESCVEELDNKLEHLQEYKSDKSKGVSKLRQYISELYKDKAKAKFMMDRISSVNRDFYKNLKLDEERKKQTSILNDLIQLHTFKITYDENSL